jgi:hypothetical protein
MLEQLSARAVNDKYDGRPVVTFNDAVTGLTMTARHPLDRCVFGH